MSPVRRRQGPLPPETVEALISDLTAQFGNKIVTSQSGREQHGHTLTWLPNAPPDAVLFVETREDVIEAVKICAERDAPVIGFGAGTSLEGHVNALHGGLCIDFSRMNQVLAVHAEDLDCVVEPGVTRKALNAHLRDSGLFFPIDPGADASIGGMAATRASGTNAVRYGTMKDNVLSLGIVTAQGKFVRTASRAKKSSAGYDLTRLIVGSEGTLGADRRGDAETRRRAGIDLRRPLPVSRCRARPAKPPSRPSSRASRWRASNCSTVCRCRRATPTPSSSLPETPMLFLEFHGSEASVAEQSRRFAEIAEANGGGPFAWTTNAEERSRLWQARHDAYWACLGLRPGARAFATDVCVPISRLAECVEETQADLAGDRPHRADRRPCRRRQFPRHADDRHGVESRRVEQAEAFGERLAMRAIAMGGTCTGEHGVGQKKIPYLEEEHGPTRST